MPDFIDQMARELARAAQAPKPRRATVAAVPWLLRRYAKELSHRQRVAVLAVLALAVAAPALAATQPWNPQPAQITAGEGAKPHGAVPTVRVSVSEAAPPAGQLRRLGVLRRPANARDHSPTVQRALSHLLGGVAGLELRYVRVLDDNPRDPLVLLLPAKRWSGPAGTKTTISGPLCVELFDAAGGGGSCESLDALTGGHLTGSFGSFDYNVVPDGVATVVLTFRDGSRQTLAVHDNFVGFKVAFAGRDGHPALPTAVEWRDRAGNRLTQLTR